MDTFGLAMASALWLGILTSLSPCPLATNLAAISFIGRRVTSPKLVCASGLLYAAGRMLAYLVLAMLIVLGALSLPALSNALQQHMNKLLGPVFLITAMFLFELLSFGGGGAALSARAARIAEKGGFLAAFILGILFALALCPVSAALFFGSLIPLALRENSALLLPLVYGFGTALPVILFAVVLAFSAKSVASLFARLTQIEKWARRVTGLIFLGLGLYFTLVYIFEV